MPAWDEIDLIENLFAPLATAPEARGLRDDAAVVSPSHPLVITADAIVERVHFLPDDPLDGVAMKALRVNFSDLAAKGAVPIGALITLMWPASRDGARLAAFAEGLKQDLAAYRCALWGGDTTSTPGPFAVSVTAFGKPCGPNTPSRADARIGDDVWVTGTIGDAALGLRLLRDSATPASPDHEFLMTRYRRPEPRVSFAPTIAALAHAAMDVSDGLIGDAAKLSAASGVMLTLQQERVPVSEAARSVLAQRPDLMDCVLDGGDDYEIIFTADPLSASAIEAAVRAHSVQATRIGAVSAGEGVRLEFPGAPARHVRRGGYRHAFASGG